MTRGARLGVIVGSMLLLSSFGASANAQRRGDGLYGRWDRGLTLSFGAGPGVTWLNGKADPNVVGEARFLVADAAGVVLSGRWGPDSGQHLFLGVDLRPLFPALFFPLPSRPGTSLRTCCFNRSSSRLGRRSCSTATRSTGLGVGFGFGIPLYRPLTTVRGLWLRIAARYVNADPSYRNTQPTDGSHAMDPLHDVCRALGFQVEAQPVGAAEGPPTGSLAERTEPSYNRRCETHENRLHAWARERHQSEDRRARAGRV